MSDQDRAEHVFIPETGRDEENEKGSPGDSRAAYVRSII